MPEYDFTVLNRYDATFVEWADERIIRSGNSLPGRGSIHGGSPCIRGWESTPAIAVLASYHDQFVLRSWIMI